MNTMKSSMKKPSLLSKKDLFDIEQIEWALNVNEEECVSQACIRFGGIEDDLDPCQKALEAFCKDNPKVDEDEFEQWYQGIIKDENIFQFDKVMLDAVKDVQALLDERKNEWIAKGEIDPLYNTKYALWGIIGIAIYTISYEITSRYNRLKNDAFYKDSMFGKYRIIALEYADEGTLKDFQNPHSYNRYDVEAILHYVIDRYGAFIKYKDYRHILDEIKGIVGKNPDCKLSETKAVIEKLAKSSSEMKFQYAFFYAGAVIEWYLENHAAERE